MTEPLDTGTPEALPMRRALRSAALLATAAPVLLVPVTYRFHATGPALLPLLLLVLALVRHPVLERTLAADALRPVQLLVYALWMAGLMLITSLSDAPAVGAVAWAAFAAGSAARLLARPTAGADEPDGRATSGEDPAAPPEDAAAATAAALGEPPEPYADEPPV